MAISQRQPSLQMSLGPLDLIAKCLLVLWVRDYLTTMKPQNGLADDFFPVVSSWLAVADTTAFDCWNYCKRISKWVFKESSVGQLLTKSLIFKKCPEIHPLIFWNCSTGCFIRIRKGKQEIYVDAVWWPELDILIITWFSRAGEGRSVRSSSHALNRGAKSQGCSIAEWFKLEMTSGSHLVKPVGHSKAASWIACSLFLWSPKYLQVCRFHCLSEQPVLLFDYCHCEHFWPIELISVVQTLLDIWQALCLDCLWEPAPVPNYPLSAKTFCSQQVNRSDCPPLLWFHETSSGVLCTNLFPNRRKMWKRSRSKP